MIALIEFLGAALSVGVWQVIRGSADAGTLTAAVAVATAGFPIRAAASSATARR